MSLTNLNIQQVDTQGIENTDIASKTSVNLVQDNVSALSANVNVSNAWVNANDYATYLQAQSNDYSTLLAAQSNDYATLLAAQANDYSTYLVVNANVYNTYTVLNDQIVQINSNLSFTNAWVNANDYTTYLSAQANDYATLLTTAANDYATLLAAQSNDYSTFLAVEANIYNTYTTLAANSDVSNAWVNANDYNTLLSAYSNDGSTLLSAQANDYSTYTTLDANVYNTFQYLNANIGGGGGDVANAWVNANDYSTYITLKSQIDLVNSNTASLGSVYAEKFEIDGSTNAFTLSNSISSEEALLVYIDGVLQHSDAYTISGLTLTLANTLPLPIATLGVRSLSALAASGTANLASDYYTLDGSTNVFALSRSVTTANNILVSLSGVVQAPDVHYVVSSNTLTIANSEPLAANVVLEVRHLSIVNQTVGGGTTGGVSYLKTYALG